MSEPDWMDVFADNLRDLMKERGYTQRTLAKESGISQATISRYLDKKQMPSIKAVLNFIYTLGCSPDDLLDFGDIIE